MSRIKNVLHGFSSAFISRNNDIKGCWGLGILYHHAFSCKTDTIVIDLISSKMTPHNSSFTKYIKAYTDYIYSRFSALSIPYDWLKTAKITINFNQPDNNPEKQKVSGHWGEPFICRVEFTDNLNRLHQVETIGRCFKQGPNRFRKSNRVFPR